jgi:hypothetical protein
MFLESTRSMLARSLRTPDDWDRYKGIIRTADARIMAEQAEYARAYKSRIAEAQEIILREEHGIRLDQLLPPNVRKFSDKEALHTKADHRVRRDHERRIAAIKDDELVSYQELTAAIRQRDTQTSTQSLTKSFDRSGPTRSQ